MLQKKFNFFKGSLGTGPLPILAHFPHLVIFICQRITCNFSKASNSWFDATPDSNSPLLPSTQVKFGCPIIPSSWLLF